MIFWKVRPTEEKIKKSWKSLKDEFFSSYLTQVASNISGPVEFKFHHPIVWGITSATCIQFFRYFIVASLAHRRIITSYQHSSRRADQRLRFVGKNRSHLAINDGDELRAIGEKTLPPAFPEALSACCAAFHVKLVISHARIAERRALWNAPGRWWAERKFERWLTNGNTF